MDRAQGRYVNNYNKRFDYRWKEFREDIAKIKKEIVAVDGVEGVLAVAMGGISLGVVLAEILNLPLYTVRVKSYQGRQRGDLYIGEIAEEMKGKTVVVVDDIIDTKQTITGLCERLKDYNVVVKNKVVLCKREGIKEDCIFGREVGRGVWCEFPWEFKS